MLSLVEPTEALDERFERQRSGTVDRIAGAIAAEVSYYRDRPGAGSDVAELHCGVMSVILAKSMPPSEAMMAVAVHALGHVPLPAALAASNVAARVFLEVLHELTQPADMGRIMVAGQHVQRYLQTLLPAVAATYETARGDEYLAARRALFDALVTGVGFDEAAERANITVAPSYSILWVRSSRDVVNARRHLQRIQAAVDEHAGEQALSGGGVFLVPVSRLDGSMCSALTAAIGDALTVGASEAGALGEVSHAVREARELADLAHKLGRGPGVYRLADLSVEFQLTRPGRARDCLMAAVRPLADHPHLMETLAAYLHHEHSRQLAAKSIHVHPNTLDYRLRRVAELTGLDPARPSGARTLAAGLLAAKSM